MPVIRAIELQLRPVPDLLKRFAPTPLRGRARFGSIEVALETNDPSFLDAFRELNGGSRNAEANFVWKLVRDHEVRDEPSEPMLVHHGPVTALSMGPACLIAVDHGACELVGFIGSAVRAETFTQTILPLLEQLSRTIGADATHELGRPLEANGANA
jgi:hypothetical protein